MSNRPFAPGTFPLRERQSIAETWAEFEKMVVGADAGPIQRREMRGAFYAGVIAMHQLMMLNLDPAVEPTELDIAYMEGIHGEIHEHIAAVLRGEA